MIELAEVVQQLRAEFSRALEFASGDDVRFELGPIELEVMVGLERSGGGMGKVRFMVIEVGDKVGLASSSTQRIKLTLRPVDIAVSGRSSSYWSGIDEAP
jgi:hypothetical protein